MVLLDDALSDLRQTIAALERKLEERTAERDGALAQQTATSEILRVIARSPTDVQPVFEAIVGSAARVCEAEFSAVARFDHELFQLVAVHSMSPEETAAFHSLFPRPPGRNFVMGRAFVEAQPVHFEDVLAELDYDSRTLEVLQSVAKYRSFLAVPIFRKGQPIGVIGCGRREVKPFTASQIELVKTFADQAAIAVENVRLFGELETRNRDLGEALAQQTATAEVLQVINSSPGDLTPVFHAMLEKAMRLCDAAFGQLDTYDGKLFHTAAVRGVPTAFAEFRSRNPPNYGPGTGPARMLSGERVLQHLDLMDEAIYHAGDPNRRALVDLGGARSSLQVALVKDEAFLGFMTLFRQEVRPFTDKQVALLQNFAAQAVIAMENARLLTETREALEQQTATAEVLQVINSSPGDLAPVFDAMLERALRLCGGSFGELRTYDGERFRLAATHGVPTAYVEHYARGESGMYGPGTGPARILAGERLIHIPDLVATEPYQNGDPDRVALVDLGGARAYLLAPLLKDTAALGYIMIYRREVGSFSDKQIALLQNFAAQAVIAMENVRLIAELRSRTRDLQEALEYQTATSDVLKVINASPGDLAPVFDAMLEKALNLCEASFGMLHTHDGDIAKIVATRNLPAPYLEYMTREPLRVGPETLHGRAIAARSVIQVADISAEEPYLNRIPLAVAAVELGDVRTAVFIPLLKDDGVPGLFLLYRTEVRPFTDKQIALLQNFAAQAVIAMENARLITETQEALDQQTATAEVLQVINSSPGDLAPVFNAMLEKAMRLCGAVFGELRTYDGETFQTAATRGVPVAFVEYRANNPPPHGPGTGPARILAGERVVHVADLMEEDAYRNGEPNRHALVGLGGVRTSLQVALLKDEAAIGSINIYRQEVRPFSGKEIGLLQNFAAQAVIAMENARLLDGIRTARDTAESALDELKAAQAKLIHSEKMASLGQLTAGIAHEIKNPLNFVNNFAELSVELLGELKEASAPAVGSLGADTRAEIDEIVGMLTGNLEKIAEHGRRADGIVKSMLAHSRGGSGERQVADINVLVDESLNLAYHGARAQNQNFNITLECDLDGSIAPIELVPQDVTRVFLNLFGNGFYAANKRSGEAHDAKFKPSLKVTTRELGAEVEIRVRDNGIGISSDIRDRMFQPFFTTKPTGEGTGLGLSISYDIITQQHGGTITVDSEVGAFTEFTVRLPRGGHTTTTGRAA